jgi:hypothetical protein
MMRVGSVFTHVFAGVVASFSRCPASAFQLLIILLVFILFLPFEFSHILSLSLSLSFTLSLYIPACEYYIRLPSLPPPLPPILVPLPSQSELSISAQRAEAARVRASHDHLGVQLDAARHRVGEQEAALKQCQEQVCAGWAVG